MDSNLVVVPPTVVIGELIPWKGKFWRVQLYDPAGGLLEFDGETTGRARAVSQNPVLVLEMGSETTGALKRSVAGEKRRKKDKKWRSHRGKK